MPQPIPTKNHRPDPADPAEEIELTTPDLTDLLPPSPGDSSSLMRVNSPVRGERILATFEKLFLLLDRLLARALPKELNPFLQTGAIAMVSLLIATGTGVLLLLWYSPSVVQAFSSVASMEAAPWTGGLVRSLHRYSSDMCMFFTLVHALRLFFERRFTGARWLAWTSGVMMLAIIWLIGWTGYWLVWDSRAQHIAVGSAKLLDALPIFADPMGRTFLVNETVNSLLFFVIFFIHMMTPLIFGVATWFHLARVSRPKFLTGKLMSYWVAGVLLLLSIFYPATSSEPANMTAVGQSFTIDGWYLLPIALLDRLGSGALWAVLLVGSALPLSIPWLLTKTRPRSASVIISRCDACGNCYTDCPYNAISMVPRTDEMADRIPTQAQVNPDLCVGCGICAGSCDTAGNGLPWFDVYEKRKLMRGWVKEMQEAGEKPYIAMLCENSAGAHLDVDPESGCCAEFPGYRILKVPCAGWIHPLTVEGLIRKGAEGVLVAACGTDGGYYREGSEWIRQRLDGERSPSLREEHVDRKKVLVVNLNKASRHQLVEKALAFQRGGRLKTKKTPSKVMAGFAATIVGLFVACLIALGSDLPYATETPENSSLVVSFRHPGQVSEVVKTLSKEELEDTPVHMRQAELRERRRMPVRIRVKVDGKTVLEKSFSPKGVWGDGPSVAVESITVPQGNHRVEIAVGDGSDEDEWQFTDEQSIHFTNTARRVLLFDRITGFSWY